MPSNDSRTYYVICEDNCKFESMTKEQIIAAIAEATGETPTHIDDAFITKIKEQNGNTPVKIWVGTNAQYNALTPVDNVLYIITDGDDYGDLVTRVTTLENNAAQQRVIINGDYQNQWNKENYRVWNDGYFEFTLITSHAAENTAYGSFYKYYNREMFNKHAYTYLPSGFTITEVYDTNISAFHRRTGEIYPLWYSVQDYNISQNEFQYNIFSNHHFGADEGTYEIHIKLTGKATWTGM